MGDSLGGRTLASLMRLRVVGVLVVASALLNACITGETVRVATITAPAANIIARDALVECYDSSSTNNVLAFGSTTKEAQPINAISSLDMPSVWNRVNSLARDNNGDLVIATTPTGNLYPSLDAVNIFIVRPRTHKMIGPYHLMSPTQLEPSRLWFMGNVAVVSGGTRIVVFVGKWATPPDTGWNGYVVTYTINGLNTSLRPISVAALGNRGSNAYFSITMTGVTTINGSHSILISYAVGENTHSTRVVATYIPGSTQVKQLWSSPLTFYGNGNNEAIAVGGASDLGYVVTAGHLDISNPTKSEDPEVLEFNLDTGAVLAKLVLHGEQSLALSRIRQTSLYAKHRSQFKNGIYIAPALAAKGVLTPQGVLDLTDGLEVWQVAAPSLQLIDHIVLPDISLGGAGSIKTAVPPSPMVWIGYDSVAGVAVISSSASTELVAVGGYPIVITKYLKLQRSTC